MRLSKHKFRTRKKGACAREESIVSWLADQRKWRQYLFPRGGPVHLLTWTLPQAVEIPDPLFNTTVFVIVTVVDRNDNPPKFPQESYSFSVKEDVARPGYIVTDQLNVRDGDKNVRESKSIKPSPPHPTSLFRTAYLLRSKRSRSSYFSSPGSSQVQFQLGWSWVPFAHPLGLELDRVGLNFKLKFSPNSRHVFHRLATSANSRQVSR